MPSAWIQHIKDFAAKNNLSYGCAMSDPQCKATYVSVKKPTKTALKKQLASALSKPSFVGADGSEATFGPTGRVVMPKKPRKKKPVILAETFDF
jgi:hypothetical protein